MEHIMLQNKNILRQFIVLLVISGLTFLAGCGSLSDDGNQPGSNMTLQFKTVNSSSSPKTIDSTVQQNHDSLTIEGSNGTLKIEDLRFIVEDFEMERSDGECKNQDGDEDECEEFESDPLFVDLPLQGDTLDLNTSAISSGLYEELEFELDDLELDDEEDQEEQSVKQQLLDEIRNEFPDWPDSVSMVIVGNFTSSQGESTSFKTFAEAEVEIEMEFNPPLEVGENTVDKLIRINIDPAKWFLRNDGTVRDLSQYDYESTGQTFEFEVEIENGFESLEVDYDDDDDSDDSDDDDNSDD